MTRLILTLALAGVCLAPAFAQSPITQADLLARVIDLDRLMTPPGGERTAMFSSYDRRSRIDERGQYVDWDANKDWGEFIRVEDGWSVMAEMEGPGAITRIWSANPQGTIRIVLDGQPAVECPFGDLFTNKVPPFGPPLCYVTPGGGHNCYFPIGYAKSCKVLARDCQSYYQINYVAFPAGTQVETFKPELSEAAQASLTNVISALAHGLSDHQLFGSHPTYTISDRKDDFRQQDSLEIETFPKGGVIRALYVGIPDRRMPPAPYALHQCLLRIYVDGETRPSVEAPLIDFFGSGFGPHFYESLVLGTDKRTSMPGEFASTLPAGGADTGPPAPGEQVNENRFMYCYFPIPFTDTARIEVKSLSEDKALKFGLMIYARVDRTPPSPDTLRFRAGYRKEDPCQVLDYPILETSGTGRIVGCTLNVDCPRAQWWGEGDDKVWIDGEKFPSYFGTGSEDYLGDAWGLHLHSDPLQGATLVAPYGKNSAYRWHIADCIDFHKSVRFTIENWQHNKVHDTYYSSVAYWYGEPKATDFFEPIKLADVTPPGLRIPDSVEIEGRIAGTGWGNIQAQKQAGGAEYSGGEAANITTDQPVQMVIPSDRERTVRLKLRVHPKDLFEPIEVTDASGRTVGTVTYTRGAEGIYTVGVIHLRTGDNRVTVRTRKAVMDCWILEDLPKSGRGPEGEDLEILSAGKAKTRVEYATLDWSAGAERVIDFAAAGDAVQFALPETKEAGARDVRLVITRGPAGGQFQALVDDQAVDGVFDAYGEQEKIDRVSLGAVQLAAGKHTLTLRADKANPKSTGLRLGLDVVELVKAASPYAVECEALRIAGFEKTNHEVQEIGGASGDAHVWCRSTEPGAWIEFEVPVKQAGHYKLGIVYTTSFDYGIVQTYVNGKKAGEPIDTFGPLQPGPIRPLGEFDLPAGPLRVKAELIGKNEKSPGYYFGVDCIILEPVKP